MKNTTRSIAWLALSSAAIVLVGSSLTPSEPPPRSSFDLVTRTGVPREWRLDVDGTVYLRLGTEDPTWFEARPTASGGIQLEELLLAAILASESAGAELTATGKEERTLRGESLEDALPLLAIERR